MLVEREYVMYVLQRFFFHCVKVYKICIMVVLGEITNLNNQLSLSILIRSNNLLPIEMLSLTIFLFPQPQALCFYYHDTKIVSKWMTLSELMRIIPY